MGEDMVIIRYNEAVVFLQILAAYSILTWRVDALHKCVGELTHEYSDIRLAKLEGNASALLAACQESCAIDEVEHGAYVFDCVTLPWSPWFFEFNLLKLVEVDEIFHYDLETVRVVSLVVEAAMANWME